MHRGGSSAALLLSSMAEVDKEDKLPGLVVAIAAPAPAGDDNDRDSFEYECKEAHRSRREFMQGGGIGIISHEHYHASDAASRYNRSCLDLYRVDDITSITDGRVLLEEGGTGPIRSTHTYAYRLQRWGKQGQRSGSHSIILH